MPAAGLAPGQSLPEYAVRARNSARQSENKIHDDTVARQFGFRGGLVPGVTIHGYLTRPALDALGPEWLERGSLAITLRRPFYENELVTVRTTVTAADANGTTLELTGVNEEGEACALATATLPATPLTAPAFDAVPAAPRAADRPPVSFDVLSKMDVLGTIETPWEEAAEAATFPASLDDDHALYREANIVHPGYLVRFANTVLSEAVRLDAWIHTSSEVQHFSTLRVGEPFATRARILELTESAKGHRIVTLDVLQVSGERVLSRNRHRAIYAIASA